MGREDGEPNGTPRTPREVARFTIILLNNDRLRELHQRGGEEPVGHERIAGELERQVPKAQGARIIPPPAFRP